ncbi:MAG: hypothetical protein K8W52_16950 [Deltaproteobacteria bacterium]|nr:hypothetical protein [Deltaproteobacteria bacterium]
MTTSPNPQSRKIFKILCPIERKDGTTFWLRVGTAFPNRDQSINLYLDVLPANQKLQLRELDEEDLRERDSASSKRRGGMRAIASPTDGAANNDLPF